MALDILNLSQAMEPVHPNAIFRITGQKPIGKLYKLTHANYDKRGLG